MDNSKTIFTRYEKFVIAILALFKFTVVLDFMVLSPLGANHGYDLHSSWFYSNLDRNLDQYHPVHRDFITNVFIFGTNLGRA